MVNNFHELKERLRKSVYEVGLKKTFKKVVWELLVGQLQQEISSRRLDKAFRKHVGVPMFREIDFHVLNLPGKGVLFLNPLDEGFSKEFSLYGFREPLNTYFVYNSVKGRKVLDIGSNLGYFPLVELNAGAKYVIAIEPVPTTFKFLQRNLAPYKDKTILLNVAISAKNGTLELYVPRKFNLATAIYVPDSKKIQCRALSLSSVMEQYDDIDTIRMDVEGYEYEILMTGIPENVECICIELHDTLGLKKTRKLLSFLEKSGFIAKWSIREIPLRYYSLIQIITLKKAYKILKEFGQASVEADIPLSDIAQSNYPHLRHLILERV